MDIGKSYRTMTSGYSKGAPHSIRRYGPEMVSITGVRRPLFR